MEYPKDAQAWPERPPVYVSQFGATGDGTTDDTAAITQAIQEAASQKTGLAFEPGKTYLTGPLTFAYPATMPLWVEGNSCTLQGTGAASDFLVTVQGPDAYHQFRFVNFTLNGGGQLQGLRIRGGQNMIFRNLIICSSAGDGVYLDAAPGYGIYYNLFESIRSGLAPTVANPPAGPGQYYNVGYGFNVTADASAGQMTNASNSFTNCSAQHNVKDGWYIDWSDNNYFGCEAERNDGYGFRIMQTYATCIVGGYSEHNRQALAKETSGGNGHVNPSGTDYSFYFAYNETVPGQTGPATASGSSVLGGRHIGAVDGSAVGSGNVFLTGNEVPVRGGSQTPRTGSATRIEWDGGVRLNGPLSFNGSPAPAISFGTASPQGSVGGNPGSVYLCCGTGAVAGLWVNATGGSDGWKQVALAP